MTKCVICKKDFKGVGANPDPISLFGVCCNSCDKQKVVPARIIEQHYTLKYGEQIGRSCIINLIHLGKKPEETIKLISRTN